MNTKEREERNAAMWQDVMNGLKFGAIVKKYGLNSTYTRNIIRPNRTKYERIDGNVNGIRGITRRVWKSRFKILYRLGYTFQQIESLTPYRANHVWYQVREVGDECFGCIRLRVFSGATDELQRSEVFECWAARNTEYAELRGTTKTVFVPWERLKDNHEVVSTWQYD